MREATPQKEETMRRIVVMILDFLAEMRVHFRRPSLIRVISDENPFDVADPHLSDVLNKKAF
jgi:hypothetical protein